MLYVLKRYKRIYHYNLKNNIVIYYMNLLFIFSYAYILKKILNKQYLNSGSDERYICYPQHFDDDNEMSENLVRITFIESNINLVIRIYTFDNS